MSHAQLLVTVSVLVLASCNGPQPNRPSSTVDSLVQYVRVDGSTLVRVRAGVSLRSLSYTPLAAWRLRSAGPPKWSLGWKADPPRQLRLNAESAGVSLDDLLGGDLVPGTHFLLARVQNRMRGQLVFHGDHRCNDARVRGEPGFIAVCDVSSARAVIAPNPSGASGTSLR